MMHRARDPRRQWNSRSYASVREAAAEAFVECRFRKTVEPLDCGLSAVASMPGVMFQIDPNASPGEWRLTTSEVLGGRALIVNVDTHHVIESDFGV